MAYLSSSKLILCFLPFPEKFRIGVYITLRQRCLYRSLPITEMKVNGGSVVEKRLLNIIKKKSSLGKTLFYNVEKLKPMKTGNRKEKAKSDYLRSFNSSSFSFALKHSSDQFSLIGQGSSFQTLAPVTETALFPFSVAVKLTRKLLSLPYPVR